MTISKKQLEEHGRRCHANGVALGRDIAMKEATDNRYVQQHQARIKLAESVAAAIRANADALMALHRMMDEGLTK